MNYTNVELPFGGSNPGRDEFNITNLEYLVGERADDYTVLHVRGWYGQPRKRGGATYSFAGYVVLREGRDAPSYDLAIMENRRLIDEQGEEVAMAIMLALDEHAEDLMMAEMERICESPPKMSIEFEPLLDQTKAVRFDTDKPVPPDVHVMDGTEFGTQMLMALPHGDWVVRCKNMDTNGGVPIKDGVIHLYRVPSGGFYRVVEGELLDLMR